MGNQHQLNRSAKPRKPFSEKPFRELERLILFIAALVQIWSGIAYLVNLAPK